jgi:TonB family protein
MLLQHASRAGDNVMRLAARILILAFAGFLAAPAFAQQPEITELAGRVAAHIDGAQAARVSVAPFYDETGKLGGLGEVLSRNLSDVLSTRLPRTRFSNSVPLLAALTTHGFSEAWLRVGAAVAEFARDAGIDLVVLGKLEHRGKQLRLTITIWHAAKRTTIGEEKARFAAALFPTVPDEPLRDAEGGPFLPGFGGVTYPECGFCPNASYTPDARRKKTQGTVVFVVTVEATGRPSDIRLIRPLEPSLDRAAGEAIATWRMKPAVGADRKSLPVRVFVEMAFRIYE